MAWLFTRISVALVGLTLVVAAVACTQAADTQPSESGEAANSAGPSPSQSRTPSPSELSAPSSSPSPPSATPWPIRTASASPDYDVRIRQQAERALDLWADVVAEAPDESVIFTTELTSGGGWNGPGDGERKQAMLAGKFAMTAELPTETPPPAEITWPDGTVQAIPLVSAAEALADLMANMNGGSCPDCQPLHVVGARLTSGPRETSRGRVDVPVWEFVLSNDDRPLYPISQPAVRDRIYLPLPPLGEDGLGRQISYAIGTESSSEVTVGFSGAYGDGSQLCGADYGAEAIESETAVVPIVFTTRYTPAPSGVTCGLLGSGRQAVAPLSKPLGSRTVLDIRFGWPVMVSAERPALY